MKPKITITFHSDPKLGWGEVSREMVNQLGVENKISGRSFERGSKVYLEEDIDLRLFILAAEADGYEIEWVENMTNQPCFVRRLLAYSPRTYVC